jgi:hypothetical protein
MDKRSSGVAWVHWIYSLLDIGCLHRVTGVDVGIAGERNGRRKREADGAGKRLPAGSYHHLALKAFGGARLLLTAARRSANVLVSAGRSMVDAARQAAGVQERIGGGAVLKTRSARAAASTRRTRSGISSTLDAAAKMGMAKTKNNNNERVGIMAWHGRVDVAKRRRHHRAGETRFVAAHLLAISFTCT